MEFWNQIYLSDLFAKKNKKILENALTETVTGTLSYNGQRCTALKLLMVPAKHGEAFAKAFVEKVEGKVPPPPLNGFASEWCAHLSLFACII